jgi:hypothetical protein
MTKKPLLLIEGGYVTISHNGEIEWAQVIRFDGLGFYPGLLPQVMIRFRCGRELIVPTYRVEVVHLPEEETPI